MTNAINSATYLPRYAVANCADASGFMSLYKAVRTLRDLASEGKVEDGTHIRTVDGRVVAFFCDYRNTVRATDYVGARAEKGARADERELVNGWSL